MQKRSGLGARRGSSGIAGMVGIGRRFRVPAGFGDEGFRDFFRLRYGEEGRGKLGIL